MDFKKFIIKVSIIIIPIYVIWFIYIETFPLYYNTSNNLRWYFINKSLKKTGEIPKTKILFLGESRVNAGINFTEIKNSYSLATGGTSPIETFFILKKYLNKQPKPQTVFFSVSPRFLVETFGFYEYSVRNDFFNFNEFSQIISTYKKNKSDTVLGQNTYIKFILYKVRYIEFYQKDILINNVFGGYSKNTELLKTMKNMSGAYPHPGLKDSCSELNYETSLKKFEASPLLDFYFDKILETCRKNRINLIFEFMPVNKSSYNKFSNKFVSDYKQYIKKYKKKYPEFSISDSVYFYEDIYFGDNSHLNSKGKNKFTFYLKEKFKM